MANTYYVDHGLATGNNDGSSPANAWQDFWAVFTGTMTNGSYAAGDTIIIRSGDRKATTTVDKTQAEIGTISAPVTWIVDDGATVTEWLGDTGAFTLETTVDNADIALKNNNIWIGTEENLVFQLGHISTAYARSFIFGETNAQKTAVIIKNALIHRLNDPSSSSGNLAVIYCNNAFFENCTFRLKIARTDLTYGITLGIYRSGTFINCTFDLYSGLGIAPGGIFVGTNYGTHVCVLGGSVLNSSPTTKIYKLGASNTDINSAISSKFYARNFAIGQCDFTNIDWLTESGNSPSPEIVYESINGLTDFYKENGQGYITWKQGEFYPALSAVLPDGSNTKWSIKCFPSLGVNRLFPQTINWLSKFWNGTESTLDVTANLLILDTSVVGGSGAFDSPTKKDWWMVVSYVDGTTGAIRTETSYDDGALHTPTPAPSWTTTNYGSKAYLVRQLKLSTQYAVKPDTIVSVTLFCGRPSGGADDFYFVCPDVVLEESL